MKKYFLITFTHSWNGQKEVLNTEVIDKSPMEWLLQWHNGKSEGVGPEMWYTQHLLFQMEITEEQYNAFKEKY